MGIPLCLPFGSLYLFIQLLYLSCSLYIPPAILGMMLKIVKVLKNKPFRHSVQNIYQVNYLRINKKDNECLGWTRVRSSTEGAECGVNGGGGGEGAAGV